MDHPSGGRRAGGWPGLGGSLAGCSHTLYEIDSERMSSEAHLISHSDCADVFNCGSRGSRKFRFASHLPYGRISLD